MSRGAGREGTWGRALAVPVGFATGFPAPLDVDFGRGFGAGFGRAAAFAFRGEGLPFLGMDLPFVAIIVENAGGRAPVQVGHGGGAWPTCTRRQRNS